MSTVVGLGGADVVVGPDSAGGGVALRAAPVLELAAAAGLPVVVAGAPLSGGAAAAVGETESSKSLTKTGTDSVVESREDELMLAVDCGPVA